jgi:hypothetical protein
VYRSTYFRSTLFLPRGPSGYREVSFIILIDNRLLEALKDLHGDSFTNHVILSMRYIVKNAITMLCRLVGKSGVFENSDDFTVIIGGSYR